MRLPVRLAPVHAQRNANTPYSPALTSSILGVVSIGYNFLCSTAHNWGTSAIAGTAVSTLGTLLYGVLVIWTYRRIVKNKQGTSQHTNLWSEQSYYSNFLTNMYPTAIRSPAQPPEAPVTEDDRVNQQMALLLAKTDARPSPDANATFRIDLPEDREQLNRHMRSQELVGTPVQTHVGWNARDRADSRPDSLGEHQAWRQWQDRGRSTDRPASTGGHSTHSRNVSREERRREIELGFGQHA
jgi:hypothetical protein